MKPKTVLTILALVLLVAALALNQATSAAQSGGLYDLSWSTVDGGGGTSTGGLYGLSGTAGQFDAGTLSSGSYTVVGGFWAYGEAAKVYIPLVMK